MRSFSLVRFEKKEKIMNLKKSYLIYAVFCILPPTRFFGIKAKMLRWAGVTVGKNVRVVSSARFFVSGKLTLGDNTWVGHDVLILGGNADIFIGRDVDIAPRVTIVSGAHIPFEYPEKAAGSDYSSPVRIEDGVWLCANVTVLGGAVIGRRTIVAAGAVVNKTIDQNCLAGGVPCKIISQNN